MTDQDFDRFVEGTNAPLVVVTVAVGPDRAGCVVGFHTQASIEPTVYAVWLSKANRTTQLALQAARVAVHYLRDDQLEVAEHWGSLTGDETDKFANVDWEPDADGVPLLAACPDRLVLERVGLIDVADADHVCWLGKVTAAAVSGHPGTPLRLADAQSLTPGHDAEAFRTE